MSHGIQNVPSVIATIQGTVSTTALSLVDFGFTAEQVHDATHLHLTVNTNDIRYRYDGVAPTIAIGHSSAGKHYSGSGRGLVDGNFNIGLFQMIRNGASDAEVCVTLEG